MRSTIGFVGSLSILLVLGSCGSDTPEVADVPPQATVQPRDPLADIPRNELYGASPAENLWNPKIELEVLGLPRGWDGARIAILNDLNLGYWDDNRAAAEAAVRSILAARPDLVVLVGGFVAEDSAIPDIAAILGPLRAVRSVAVLGTGDVQTEARQSAVLSALRTAGATVLRDTAVAMTINGDTAWIAGIDPNLGLAGGADQNFVVSTLGVDGRTPLLLTHSPLYAARAPNGRYPVVIAGDTFCGELPIEEAPTLNQLATQTFPGGQIPETERLFRIQGQTLLISCGTGFGYVPVRFGAPPEVPILTLRRLGRPDEPATGDLQALSDSLLNPDTAVQSGQ